MRGDPGRQVRDLRLKPGKLLPQHRDLCVLPRDPLVPLGQQLPQPRVRSTKPRSIIGNTGHLGHAPNYTTTPHAPQISSHRTAAASGNEPRTRGGVQADLSSYPAERTRTEHGDMGEHALAHVADSGPYNFASAVLRVY